MGKSTELECLFVHRKKELFLSFNVDDINMAGRKQNMTPMWKKLMKLVDLGQPTSFLGHIYLLNVNANRTQPLLTNTEKMFESRISAGEIKKKFQGGRPRAKTVAWSYNVDGHAKKCFEGHCELANKSTKQLYKISTPCLDDHHFKKELESFGELPEACSLIVLKCLCLARIGWLDIL